jgi:hypothetical protein
MRASLCNNLQDTLLHVLWACMARLKLHMLQALPLLGILPQSDTLQMKMWCSW